jgi:hypothetical protein
LSLPRTRFSRSQAACLDLATGPASQLGGVLVERESVSCSNGLGEESAAGVTLLTGGAAILAEAD